MKNVYHEPYTMKTVPILSINLFINSKHVIKSNYYEQYISEIWVIAEI
jgi:hypothetical protein